MQKVIESARLTFIEKFEIDIKYFPELFEYLEQVFVAGYDYRRSNNKRIDAEFEYLESRYDELLIKYNNKHTKLKKLENKLKDERNRREG